MADNLVGLRRYLEKYATLAENRKRNIDIVANEFTVSIHPTFVMFLLQFIIQNVLFLTQEIRNISADLKKKLTTNEGAKDVNRKKNRYKDILPCKFLSILCVDSHNLCSQLFFKIM